jgi:hypothetical protein
MIQRTLGIVIASGMLASVSLANIGGGTMEGGAFLQAGDMFDDHVFSVPATETFVLDGAPSPQGSASTTVKVNNTVTADTLSFDFDIVTTGTGESLGGADVFLEFVLLEAANFNLVGTLSGLTFFQSTVQGNDNPALIYDELFYDQFGYFGTLVDGGGNPVADFVRQGVLEAGSYTFALSSFSEALPGAGDFDGVGHLTLTLTAIPAPSALLAFAAPGLLLARRRRA